MKKGWKFRRMIVVLGVLSLSIFAWGCGQTAPTAVDVQSIQTQGTGADVTDGGETNQWN